MLGDGGGGVGCSVSVRLLAGQVTPGLEPPPQARTHNTHSPPNTASLRVFAWRHSEPFRKEAGARSLL